jgi:uncharacterized protein (DUF983 family)
VRIRGRQHYLYDMKHQADFAPGPLADRPLIPALGRGWRRRCPCCGGGPLFEGYLKVRRSCASCGEALHHHRADDIPAWAVILITGKVLVLALLAVETTFAPPVWVHWALWPAATLAMVLWLLPRVKGSVVGLQWSQRMHGFGGSSRDTLAGG